MASEFDLIARYFTRSAPAGLLGVGDDCALFPAPAGEQIATSTDLLLEGRHFFPDVDPRSLGHKSLAVNLSDLAAMGARPIGCVLGLALPRLDEPWLAAFADGFHALAAAHGCPLIGGDTTRSAHDLAISVTVFGAVPAELALRRDGARADDDIWCPVSWARPMWPTACSTASIRPTRSGSPPPGARWNGPSRRWRWAWRCVAWRGPPSTSPTACCGPGPHPGRQPVGAALDYASLPVATALGGMPEDQRLRAILGGGDVYQLCFTAPAARRDEVSRAALAPARASRASAAPRRRGSRCGMRRVGPWTRCREATITSRRPEPPPTGYRPTPCLPTTPIPHHARAQAGRLSHAGLGLPRSGAADRLRAGQRPDPPGVGHLGHRAGLAHLGGRRADRSDDRRVPGAGFLYGCWACDRVGRELHQPDHVGMVWDEMVAFWLVLWLTPAGWLPQAVAFVLFRAFDIVKPPPIKFFDARLKGGFGVMWDDIVAAGYALLIMALAVRTGVFA